MSDSVTPGTVAHQAPLSMGILQARILEWVVLPTPGDLPHPGIKPMSPASPALAGGFFTIEPVVFNRHQYCNYVQGLERKLADNE